MLLLGFIAACGSASPPQTVVVIQTVVVTASNTFSYPIRVQSKETGENIANARITIEVAGKAPLDEVTDTNGYARIFIDIGYTGQPSKLIVQSTGYKKYVQSIDLNRDILPDVIQLEVTSFSESIGDSAPFAEASTTEEQSVNVPADTPVPSTNTPFPTNTTIPPTATSIPLPTKIPNTPPGTVLAPGEPWIQNGVVAILDDYYILGPDLVLNLDILNNTGHPISFEWNFDLNVSVRDNLGNIYSKGSGSYTKQPSLRSGDKINLFWMNFVGPVTHRDVTSVTLTIRGMSQIDEATWQIPIYH